jgi:DNA-binding response OmpR family regulator
MTDTKVKILLVEDDSSLGFVIQDILRDQHFIVHLATDGAMGLQKFSETVYDLCLLDVMLPKKDGFTLAREIRKLNTEVPIVFLTAKSMNEDKIEGFHSGADDYITKPFSQEEFLLRVKAILKRSGKQQITSEIGDYTIGEYVFDPSNFSLKHRDEERKLTRKEAGLLKLLCENKGKVVERDFAASIIWGETSYFVGRSMDVFITRLRKYLKNDPRVSIQNIHGVGFKLEDQGKSA